MPAPLQYWLQLSLTDGIGPILAARLVAAAGSAEAACGASLALLQSVEGIGAAKASNIRRAMREVEGLAAEEMELAAKRAIRIYCPDDAEYPLLLRDIPDPPMTLYVRGALEPRDLHAVAIVGSRRCSLYGREQAERFAALLAGAGVCVVSGGARGVDSSAHRGALSHPQGRTIAVLGCGIDIVYPPENGHLFDLIAARGAVVSEYPLGTGPMKENFPRRNRIISGMSRGVLVVEADQRSGALITARQACDDHGRTVFAVPGKVDNPLSAGPHQLIRDGAVLTATLEDILDNLGRLPDAAYAAEGAPDDRPAASCDSPDVAPPGHGSSPAAPFDVALESLTAIQRQILDALGADPTPIDLIIERTNIPASAALGQLTYLTLKGLVHRPTGQTYARRKPK